MRIRKREKVSSLELLKPFFATQISEYLHAQKHVSIVHEHSLTPEGFGLLFSYTFNKGLTGRQKHCLDWLKHCLCITPSS